ncbi:MAG: sigma 54-interacting transcriptional regulator, partial [Cyanobacteria bacterium P01_F01_bin.143]
EIIGDSTPMQALREQIEKVAVFNQDILLIGETGVGKEVVAKAIHRYSQRNEEVLITINMAAIPESLAESELFGYEKGAFTGANQSRPGKFELSHKGTIFLDELEIIRRELEKIYHSVDCRVIIKLETFIASNLYLLVAKR